MRNNASTLIISIITLAFAGCYYDKAETLFPPEPKCDTANMRYSTNIQPILNTSCVVCHSSTSSNGGRFRWAIENFGTLQARAMDGSLVGRITLPQGHQRLMPLNGTKLDTCTILKIKAWVNRGALNN